MPTSFDRVLTDTDPLLRALCERVLPSRAHTLFAVMLVEGLTWEADGDRAVHHVLAKTAEGLDVSLHVVTRGAYTAAVAAGRSSEMRWAAKLRALAAATHARLAALAGDVPISIGMGGAHGERAGLVRSYTEAKEALRLGERLSRKPAWTFYEDALVPAALAADPALLTRLSSLVDPIDAYDRRGHAVLMETLRTFFEENLEMRRVAKRLGIHPHTVVYRLKLAERLLGRSVRHNPDRLLIEAALHARALH